MNADIDRLRGLTCWLVVLGVFATHSLLLTPLPGVNEPHYLCKAKAFQNPDWCSHDFFLQSQNAHYCFYLLVGPLTEILPLAAVAVVGRLLSLGLLAWSWIRLAAACGLKQRSVLMAAVCFVILDTLGSFSGEWIIGGFESKVPAWGFGFAGLAFWLEFSDQGRRIRLLAAGGLTGCSIALHPVVGLWFLIAIGMSEITLRAGARLAARSERTAVPTVTPDSEGIAGARSGLAIFFADAACYLLPCLIAALPGLIPALQVLMDDRVSAENKDLANFIQVFWRLKHHLDPSEFPMASWVRTGLLLALVTVVWLSPWMRNRLPQRRVERQRALLVLGMALLIAGTGVLIGWHTTAAKELPDWQWRASLLKFYPFRLFDGLLTALTAISAALVTQLLRQYMTRSVDTGVSTSDSGWLPQLSRVQILILPELLLATFWVSLLCMKYGDACPGGYSAGQYADWKVVCDWIRRETPSDALFLTPRESFGFKWFAQRSEYVVYKDCPQDASGILEWNRRLWYLHDWTLKSSADGHYDTDDLKRLRKNTGVDYIVTRILGPFTEAPVFEGRVWQVYRVPGDSSEISADTLP